MNPLPTLSPDPTIQTQLREKASAIGDGVVELAGDCLVEVVIEAVAAGLEVLGNL